MIQDILPDILNNHFEPLQPESEDRVIVFTDDRLLVHYDAGNCDLVFPCWENFSGNETVVSENETAAPEENAEGITVVSENAQSSPAVSENTDVVAENLHIVTGNKFEESGFTAAVWSAYQPVLAANQLPV